MMRAKIVACLAVLGATLVVSPARATAADPRFLASSVQSGDSVPVATAIGDVSGDGLADLIVANDSGGTSATDGRVFVFEQNPTDPTLSSSPAFSVRPSAASNDYKMAVGDLNGDGTGDLAVGIPGVGIDVFFGTGTDLPSLPDVTIAAPTLVDLAIGDLNGDHLDDLVSTETASSYDVVLRSQIPDLGGFTSGTVLAHNVPASGLSLGDVNDDGATDFALDGPYDAPTAPAVYLQDAGLHTFAEHDVTLSTDVTRLFLADVNHDGSLDVVAAEVGGTLGWAIGNGDGTFGPFSSSVDAPQFSAKEVGDLNGDGRDDVATLSADGVVRVYVQQDGGGLGAPCAFPAPDASGDDAATSIGDLTGDAAAEIAAADGGGDLGAATVFRQLTGGQKLVTSLSLAPTASSIVYGDTVTLSGALSNPDGGCLRTGSVVIHRSGPVGGTVVDTVTLGPDLTFTTDVTPPSGGMYSYWATWAGDETHTAATSSDVQITVAKAVTSLGLSTSRGTVVFGNPVTLTATLHGVTNTPKVRFFRIIGATKTLIGAVNVDANGVAKLKITPGRNASYRAAFPGGPGTFPSTSPKRSVDVRVVVVGSMVKYVDRRNSTAIYNCCKAFYHFVVKPKIPGGTVRVAVQYLAGGTWHKLPAAVDTFTLGSDGTDTIFLHVAGGKGYSFRVRSYFASDGAHLGAWSSYVRFRFR